LSEKQPEMRWFGWQLDTQYKHIRILTLSDLHHGALLSSMKHFQKAIQFVKDNDDVRLVLSGDLCESTLKTSKGDVYQQVGSPEDQRDQVIETLRPVKEKILGMCTGNHEGRIYDVAGIDISKSIAKELHVPYRPEGILLKISFGEQKDSLLYSGSIRLMDTAGLGLNQPKPQRLRGLPPGYTPTTTQ
jgi:predicted MPP superfamily phosphohydrolase